MRNRKRRSRGQGSKKADEGDIIYTKWNDIGKIKKHDKWEELGNNLIEKLRSKKYKKSVGNIMIEKGR